MTWAGSDGEAATGRYLTGSCSVTAEINRVHMVPFRRFSTFCRASILYFWILQVKAHKCNKRRFTQELTVLPHWS